MFWFEEFDITSLEKTGRREGYLAPDRKTAIQMCLYTKRLADGKAQLGPTGVVIRTQGKAWICCG